MIEPLLTKAAANRVRGAAVTAALVELARFNVPTDVQGFLLAGDPKRGIAPGALEAAIMAGLRTILEFGERGYVDA